MGTKVKELDNLKDGPREGCSICNPSQRMVREDQVWSFVQANPGVNPWRNRA
jgi:hypothetical protein